MMRTILRYRTESLDYDEDPTAELNKLAEQGWRLVAAIPFSEEDSDERGYSYKTRKIRYIMECNAKVPA